MTFLGRSVELAALILLVLFCLEKVFPKTVERMGGISGIVLRIVVLLWRLVVSCVKLLAMPFPHIFRWLRGPNTLFGAARWLKFGERRRVLSSRNKGHFIGHKLRISKQRAMTHMAIVGPTGSGKSSFAYAYNCAGLTEDTQIITDPKAELYDLTSDYLAKKHGFRVLRFNLNDPSNSDVVFNPLDYFQDYSEIRLLSKILVEATYAKSSGDQIYFNSGAEKLISILLSLVKELDEERQNLMTVVDFLDMIDTPEQESLDKLIKLHLPDRLYRAWVAYKSEGDNARKSITSSARIALDPLNDPTLQSATSGKSNLDIPSFRRTKTAFYIITSPAKPHLNFILTVLYKVLLDNLMVAPGKKDLNVFCLCDEFAQMPAVPQLDRYISYVRSFRISLCVGLQSFEQLGLLYGKEAAQVIFENIGSLLVMPGLSIDSAERISKTIGDATVSYSEAGFADKSKRDKHMQRRLFTAQEVRTMSDGEMIYLYRSLNPVKLSKVKPYFKNKRFLRTIGRR